MGRLRAKLIGLALLFVASKAHAELGSTGALSVGIGISAGFQTDSRGCDTAGSSRSLPNNGACILWAGGVDVSMLWRGHIGAALGVFSVSGQAAYASTGQSAAAFPDRVSVPLLVDFRPLSFVLPASQGGYLSRVLYGIRLGLGPSLEFVRTASDSSTAYGQRTGSVARALFGMHFSLDGEVPLQSAAHGLSLRVSTRILYAPIVVLNDGLVQSTPVVSDVPPVELPRTFLGYATHAQVYLGLVYYL